MNPVVELSAPGAAAEQRAFVSEVLHKLSQPLTALQCSLELALVRDRTPEEFRASVEAALQNAERMRQNLLLLRELSDADDPGDTSVPLNLQELLLELREDFLPVFESGGGRFEVNCDPVQIAGNGGKLRRAFFYLLESLLRRSRYQNLNVDVQRANGKRAEIRMTFSGGTNSASSTHDISQQTYTGELEIALRSFRAVGGDLTSVASACERSIWIAGLPLAE